MKTDSVKSCIFADTQCSFSVVHIPSTTTISQLPSLQPGHSVGMLAAVEHGPILCSDSNILSLSWKGRVPKSEKDKPVCRRRYYEEGWLATGNGRGVVGVTFTSSHCRRDRNTPQRINFNLRGHNSEVGHTHSILLLSLWLSVWQSSYLS